MQIIIDSRDFELVAKLKITFEDWCLIEKSISQGQRHLLDTFGRDDTRLSSKLMYFAELAGILERFTENA